MTRRYVGTIGHVLGGWGCLPATSAEAAKAIPHCRVYLEEHRGRPAYPKLRRRSYPFGRGGIEASNKCMCHGRLKRSGAWGYEINSNQL